MAGSTCPASTPTPSRSGRSSTTTARSRGTTIASTGCRPTADPVWSEGDVVLDWEVPMVVDGQRAVVHGTLVLEHGVSPLPWAALGVALCAAVVAAGWARRRSLACAVDRRGRRGRWRRRSPDGRNGRASPTGSARRPPSSSFPSSASSPPSPGSPAPLARPPLAAVGALGSSAALLGWAVLRIDVLRFPVLPTELPAGVDRALTVVALALGLAGAVLAVRSGGLALPEARFADERGDGHVEGGLSPG